MYDITYSPATIRGYFKKLGEEGYLAQEHISSGRTPTIEALKQYWESKLNFKLKGLNLRALEYFASEIGLSVFIKKEKSDVLKDILNVEKKYMILEFSSFAISVKYSDALYRFLNDMIGLDLKDITKVSKDVGAYEVYESINQTLQNSDFQIFNYKEFLNLALNYDFDEYTINSFLKGQILDELTEGLYFDKLLPSNYIGICNYCKINNEDVKMLVIGELPKDYEYFYEKITTFQEININEKKEELIQETTEQEVQSEVVVEEATKEESLEDKIASLEQQLKDSEDKYLRVHADFENIKKRLEREKYQAIDYASEKFAKDLLAPIDTLELALASSNTQVDAQELLEKVKEGIALTIKSFNTTFEKHNISKIETDGEFDPNVHNAVMQVDSENHKTGQIVSELQKGYMLKDRLLRPSMVSIAN